MTTDPDQLTRVFQNLVVNALELAVELVPHVPDAHEVDEAVAGGLAPGRLASGTQAVGRRPARLAGLELGL